MDRSQRLTKGDRAALHVFFLFCCPVFLVASAHVSGFSWPHALVFVASSIWAVFAAFGAWAFFLRHRQSPRAIESDSLTDSELAAAQTVVSLAAWGHRRAIQILREGRN